MLSNVKDLINELKENIEPYKGAVLAVMRTANEERNCRSTDTVLSGFVDTVYTFTDAEGVDRFFEAKQYGVPKIKRVIFRNPATIVFWADGTKTVVRCGKDEPFSEYNGLINAIAKRAYGGTAKHFHEITDKAIRNAERQGASNDESC